MWRRLSVTIGLFACATPTPSESTLGVVWTGTPSGDMVALTPDDGRLPPRWQALPTWWVQPGWTSRPGPLPPIPEIQVLPDEAGEPAWVLIGGGSRSAVQLRGLGGRKASVPVVPATLAHEWVARGLDGRARMSARIALAEEFVPIGVELRPDEAPRLVLPPGLSGRVWFDGTRDPEVPFMATIDGPHGSLFLQGGVDADGLTLEPMGGQLRTLDELRTALADGCIPSATVSLAVERSGSRTRITAHETALQLRPQDTEGIEVLPHHGLGWKDAAGRRAQVYWSKMGSECAVELQDADLEFDADGLCGPISVRNDGHAMYSEKLPSTMSSALWSRVGEAGIEGICHRPDVGEVGGSRAGLRATGEVAAVHRELVEKSGWPCRFERETWKVGECRPLPPTPPLPPAGAFQDQRGERVSGVEARFGADGISLEGPSGRLARIAALGVPAADLFAVYRSAAFDVLLDRNGDPGWLALPMETEGWVRMVTLADHARPFLPFMHRSQLSSPSVGWTLKGSVRLGGGTDLPPDAAGVNHSLPPRAERRLGAPPPSSPRPQDAPVELTVIDERVPVPVIGLGQPVWARVTVDERAFAVSADRLTLWLTGPAGKVLLTARMPAAPELVGGTVVVPVALSPAPAVYPDRAALVAHLAEGGCIDDAVLAMNTGSGKVVRIHRSAFADHAAGYDRMHLQSSVEGYSVDLDEPAPNGWQGAAFLGGLGMPYLSAEDWLLGGSVFVDRYGVTGVSVEQPHRCGDPVTPIAPPPMFPTRAVTIRSAPPGEGLRLDGKPIVTPVTVHLEIGLTYGLHHRRGTTGYGQSLTVTVDGPDEVCVTMDPSDDGCATASP